MPGVTGGLVLVVDDAPDARMAAVATLRAAGMDVEVAVDGASAIDAAQRLAPAVVVLDLGLPDMDGLEVCARLREFSAARILMLTGRDGSADRAAGMNSGADRFAVKPLVGRELTATVRELLDGAAPPSSP
jgi:DNA-binding response OmpR family regulator